MRFLMYSFLLLLLPLSTSPQCHASSSCSSFLLSIYYVGGPKPGVWPFTQELRPWRESVSQIQRPAQPQAAARFETISAPCVQFPPLQAGLKAQTSGLQPGSRAPLCGAWLGAWGLSPTSHPPAPYLSGRFVQDSR